MYITEKKEFYLREPDSEFFDERTDLWENLDKQISKSI